MEPTLGTKPLTPLKYSARFTQSGDRFEDFEKKFQSGELFAWKETPEGKLLYRYADGAILLDGKGVSNRRAGMLALFNISGVGEHTVPVFLQRGGWRWRSGYEEIEVVAAEGDGVVAKLGDHWVEATKITKSMFTRNNGIDFNDPLTRHQVPASVMTAPGYMPLMKHDIEVQVQGRPHFIEKADCQTGRCTIWVRPSDMRVFYRASRKVPRTGKLRRQSNWNKRDSLPKVTRLGGHPAPIGAMCAAQLPKMLGIGI